MRDEKEHHDVTEITDKAVKSVKWTFLAQVLPRISGPIVILFLARLLTPDAFGIVAIATIVIGFAGIFQTLGFEQAIIQRETDIHATANIVFWTNVTLSVFIYVSVYFAAPFVAVFFHVPTAVPVIRVLCLQIILTAFVTVHSALLQRDFQFKSVFFAGSTNAIIPLVVTVPLAFLLHNVWALVIGSLVGSTVQLGLFWYFSRWRPALSYDTELAKKLMRFGTLVTIEMLCGWALVYGDNLVVGYALGAYALGVYTVGYNFVNAVFSLVTNPLPPVAYASFSRLQAKLNEKKQLFSYNVYSELLLVWSLLALGASASLTRSFPYWTFSRLFRFNLIIKLFYQISTRRSVPFSQAWLVPCVLGRLI